MASLPSADRPLAHPSGALVGEDRENPEAAWPRVGHIRFLNCLPLYWGLERTGGLVGLHLVPDTPDRLSDALVAGAIDIGPVSVVEYLRHHEDLLLLPDLAVGADGPVQSVVMVSRVAPSDLEGRRVALGSTSRTSVLLARLLLEQRHGIHAHYVTEPPDLAVMLRGSAAAVLIGDPALRATLMADRDGLRVVDLAAEWREWTGLPMVFAVWAVRREYWDAEPDRVTAVLAAFQRSRHVVAQDVEAVARDVASGTGVTAEQLARYFSGLDFSLGERQRRGMALFAEKVAALAGTAPDVSFRFVPET